MLRRWLAAGILFHLAIIPFVGHGSDPHGVSDAPSAPARRREPMPVRASMPNGFRISPAQGPLQAAVEVRAIAVPRV